MAFLVIHHFEEMWAESLKRYHTSLNNEYTKIIDFIDNNKENLDGVVMSLFDNSMPEELQDRIHNFCNDANIPFKRYEYGYGWNKDQYDLCPELIREEDKGITWCDATRSYYDPKEGQILEIDDWQRDLKNKNVFLCGAFEGECLDDMFTVLKTVGANVEFVKGICVGQTDEYIYSYNGKTHLQMRNEFQNLIEQVDSLIEEGNDFEDALDNLKDFLKNNERYTNNNFYEDWKSENYELYEYMETFFLNDFDDTGLEPLRAQEELSIA